MYNSTIMPPCTIGLALVATPATTPATPPHTGPSLKIKKKGSKKGKADGDGPKRRKSSKKGKGGTDGYANVGPGGQLGKAFTDAQ